MFKKRGQVSIYILIGVVIIIIVGLSFYIVGNTILKESGRDLDIRPELIPAKNFIDSCILDVAREGVDLIGLQGGNVNIEEEVIVNPLVKFGNSLDLFGNGALNVNYWFYRTPNGINTLSVPSEQDMEREIGEYIMRNIASCYEDLALFDQYDVSYSSTSKINVDIKEDRVLINVESPLEITSGGITSNLNKFSVVLDTKLGKLYSLGRGILEKENEKLFFEEMTIDMIGLYDEIPGSNVEFTCDKKTWRRSQVESDFKKIVETNVQNVGTFKTERYYSLGVGSTANVNFRYSKEWPFEIGIIPDEGEIMEGESIIERKGPLKYLSSFVCLNSYHFVYDVAYPVLVTLEEDGDIFQYAFMVVVDNNQPRKNIIEFDLIEEDDFDVCKVRNHNVDVSVVGIEGVVLSPLDNAQVSFNCFNSVCDIGSTVNGGLDEAFPQCLNGKITAEKEGYDKAEVLLDTNSAASVSITLEPLYPQRIKVKVIDKKTGIIRDVQGETANLEFTEENGYSTYANYPESKILELRDGHYTVSVNVLKNGEITIPEQEIERCYRPSGLGVFGSLFVGEKCVTEKLGSLTLNNVLIGGNNFELGLDRGELAEDNELVVYAIVQDTPLSQNDLINGYDSIENNHLNENFRLPEFV